MQTDTLGDCRLRHRIIGILCWKKWLIVDMIAFLVGFMIYKYIYIHIS